MVRNGDPEIGLAPIAVTVTGEMDADLAEPNAAVVITFVDFAISVDGTLTEGHLAATNIGKRHQGAIFEPAQECYDARG